MRHHLLVPLLLPALSMCTAAVQSLPSTPETAAERFVALNNVAALQSPEGKALLGGELAHIGAPGGGTLPLPNKLLSIGCDQAVARIPAGPGGNPDLYLFMSNAGRGWQATAVRTLALTGMLEALIQQDAEATSRTPEVEQAVRNARLVLSSDQQLVRWAADHRDFLDRARTAPDPGKLQQELEQLGGTAVRIENDRVIVSLGGMMDNEVGFLFAPKAKVPTISPRDYIWIEEAGGGWYLFKTT